MVRNVGKAEPLEDLNECDRRVLEAVANARKVPRKSLVGMRSLNSLDNDPIPATRCCSPARTPASEPDDAADK